MLSDFALSLDVLDGYDNQNLEIKATSQPDLYKDAKNSIRELREKWGGSALFGNEKDELFKSSISAINQTFDGQELYPSIEEKVAHLLYFIVKNHSFSDGNKRIATWVFIWYLNKNHCLYNLNEETKVGNNALAALALMIALSKPEEKDIIIKVFLNKMNE